MAALDVFFDGFKLEWCLCNAIGGAGAYTHDFRILILYDAMILVPNLQPNCLEELEFVSFVYQRGRCAVSSIFPIGCFQADGAGWV